MLINDSSLRFSEPDEVDDVAEDLDQAWMSRSVEVAEGEVLDATLEDMVSRCSPCSQCSYMI